MVFFFFFYSEISSNKVQNVGKHHGFDQIMIMHPIEMLSLRFGLEARSSLEECLNQKSCHLNEKHVQVKRM